MLRHAVLADRATPNPGGAPSSAPPAAPTYARHAPQRTLLCVLVQAHYRGFLARLAAQDRSLPEYVREAFEAYLRCGVLEHGVLRVVCAHCHAERLVAFSCKQRGVCPSCGARRMAESARHLVEDVFRPRQVRQWVLSVPFPLRWLFASKPQAIGPVLATAQRVIGYWLADQAGIDRATAQCGAVTLIQRFGSALNLNVHCHMLWLDGVYEEHVEEPQRKPRLHRARVPTSAQLTQLAGAIAHRVCRHLARRGLLEGEGESAYLSDSAGGDAAMDALRMSSITYRIATGRGALMESLDAGCDIGITGCPRDERRGQHLRELVERIPADRLMFETDCPSLLPRTLKDRGEDVAVPAATTATARAFFGLPPAG